MKLMAALAFGATLLAQAPPDGPGMRTGMAPGMGGRTMRMPPGPMASAPWLAMLNLTEAQQKAVQGIRDQHKPALEARHKAAMAKAGALHDALEEPATTEAQLRALNAAESEARLQVLLEERSALQEINGVLTRDQQAKALKLRQLMQKEREIRREIMDEAAGPGPGMPPPPGCGMLPSHG
jgi:Spy/CpxP family protein refolding chaperone